MCHFISHLTDNKEIRQTMTGTFDVIFYVYIPCIYRIFRLHIIQPNGTTHPFIMCIRLWLTGTSGAPVHIETLACICQPPVQAAVAAAS